MLAAAGVLLGAVLATAPATAATSSSGLYISGAGSGHGIGMSQYGAAGYALHGVGYQQILRNYYAQTTLGHVSPDRIVTVLLRARGAATFSGANAVRGSAQKLNPAVNYNVLPVGGRLRVVSGGHRVGMFAAPLQVTGPGPVKLFGQGAYRGALVFRPAPNGAGVTTVNAVGLEDYVRGVVPAEMPANWPQQALEAQAVAARTYAIAAHPITAGFAVYDSTRSQMYGGVAAETPATDAAVAATSGQVVEYNGAPVMTYFFSSSGGQTESVQNVFQIAPEAWLVSRADPYDDALGNPYHHWKLSFSLRSAQAKLGKFVKGSLEGIKVIQRGVSPRIVKAQVVGTKGSVSVSGVQLRQRLGTPSAWMSFTTVTARGVQTSTTPAITSSTPVTTTTVRPPTITTGAGGLLRDRARTSRSARGLAVTGTVFPIRAGARVTIQSEVAGAWRPVASGKIASRGRYSIAVARPGSYRVLYNGIAGRKITVG